MGLQPMLTRLRPSSVLNRTSITNRFTTQAHYYSSESDRKPKSGGTSDADPDPQISTSAKNDSAVDSKPIVISGRGRRANHRSAPSIHSKQHQYGFVPKLALPFKPLSSNHLAHLRPATLFLDLFFSLQRPLLEIELGPTERRSITSESKQAQPDDPDLLSSSALEDADDEEVDYPHIASGSPSDPAFKPPHPSSARLAPDDTEVDDQLWSTSDPYSAFLIAEPDGVPPAWSDALKRCLATSQAFVPPPVPKVKQDADPQFRADTRAAGQASRKTSQSQKEIQADRERQRALKYLNPYGSTTQKVDRHDEQPAPEAQHATTSPDHDPLPQDQLSLTMQAARFLHSGMMYNRWPSAANWAAIDSRLKAAAEKYSDSHRSGAHDHVHEFTDSFPAIRGQDRAGNSGRRGHRAGSSRQRMTIHGETAAGHTFSFNTQQLADIIRYSRRIIKHKLGIDAIPTPILRNLERFGEFLIHKHLKTWAGPQPPDLPPGGPKKHLSSSPAVAAGTSPVPIVIIDPSSVPTITERSSNHPDSLVINLDSVFRKKKRKMKVHKYKKRRKARRTLKKRQGK